jgi:hypothetical protein
MRIKTNIVKLLAVLAILGSLVAIAAVPAFAAAAYEPNPISGTVGQGITIQATGFIEGQILSAKFDGVTMTTSPSIVTVPVSGNINFTVTIPTTTAGVHKILVLRDGQEVTPPGVDFTVLQKVVITSPTTKTGPVGTSVSVAGTGFSGAGVTADVRIGTGDPLTDPVLAAGVPVDNTGSFVATGTVPQLGSGDAIVWATDGAGNAADVTATFKVTPTMIITPNSGLPGAAVVITGSGWPVAPAHVDIRFAGDTVVSDTFETNAFGQIVDGAYQIPVAATAGVKTVTGTSGTVTSTSTFTVSARVLTMTPSSGPGGTKVVLTGTNMTHNGTIAAAALKFNSAQWATGTISIDSAGTVFPTTLYVPTNLAAGTYTVMATDSGSLIAYGAFAVTKPTIALNPTTGAINTSFTVTGTGWLPGTTTGATVAIEFRYNLGAASTTISTTPDGSGNIAAAITVPADAAAGYATVSAADSKLNSAQSATFTVPGAIVTVTPATGAAGTTVSVAGSGFAAYTAISVKIGGYKFLSQPLTDPVGAFTYTFTVPGLAAGAQPVSASDGDFTSGSTASAYFVITATGATVQSQTAGISSQLVRIWGYSGGTWSMYDPADAAGSNLATLVAGNGYWINVNAACTLIYGGYSYPLSAGWNLIGWR